MPPAAAATRAAASKPRKSKDGAKKASGRKSQQPAEPAPVKAEEDLIADHVSAAQATKAFNALLSYQLKTMSEGEGANDLLAGGPESPEELRDGDVSDKKLSVYVNVALKEGGAEKRLKPYRIPLAHSLAGSGSGKRTVCLLTPDPQRWWKDTLSERGVTSVDRVVGVAKLAGKFKAYDARRQLMNDYDLFLADDRLTPILPRLLGSKFFDSKKQPVLLNLRDPEKIKAHIQAALDCTTFIPTRGVSASVRIGHLRAHTPEQLTENLRTALPAIVQRLPGGWSNVQALDVKLAQSAALPVWNCFLGAGPTKKDGKKGKDGQVAEDAWRWNLNGAELEKARADGAAREAEWTDTQTAALLQAAEDIGNPDFPTEALTGKRKRAEAEEEKPSKKPSKKTAEKEGKKASSSKNEPAEEEVSAPAEESDSSLTEPEIDAASEPAPEAKSASPAPPSKPSQKASKGKKASAPVAKEAAAPAPAKASKAKGKKGKKA